MSLQVRDKFAREFTNLFVGDEKSDTFKVIDIRIIKTTDGITKDINDLVKHINELDYEGEAKGFAEATFIAYKGSLFYLYAHSEDNNIGSITLGNDRFYVNGYIISAFGTAKELNGNPFLDFKDIDGLVTFELDVDEDEYDIMDLFEDNFLFDDDTVKLIPLVYELLASEPIEEGVTKEYVDNFIKMYDDSRDKYGNSIVESKKKMITIDIETDGLPLGRMDSIFADVPKTYIPKSDGNLFSV